MFEQSKLLGSPGLQHLVLVAVFATGLGNTAIAGETKIFKWIDANGVTSYSQKPPAHKSRELTVIEVDTKTLTPAQRAAAKAHLAHIDAKEEIDSARFRRQIASADLTVNRALRLLSQAESAARDGRTPLPGERVGNAGGGSRLRSEYFDRQKRLEDAIQEGRARVDQAYRMRSQIMP